MAAKGAEKLYLLMPELLPMAVKFSPAFGTSSPENPRHTAKVLSPLLLVPVALFQSLVLVLLTQPEPFLRKP